MIKVYNEKYQLRFYRLKLVLKHLLSNLKKKYFQTNKKLQQIWVFQIVVINYSRQTLKKANKFSLNLVIHQNSY